MRKFTAVMVFLTMVPSVAFALPTLSRMKTKLNQNVVPSDGNLFRLGDQLTNKKIQVMKVSFDTSKTGATSASQTLAGLYPMKDVDGSYATLPSGAVIKEAWMDVVSGIQKTGVPNPNICFQLQGTCDLKLMTTFNDYQKYGTTVFRQILPLDGTTVMKLTADRVVYGIVEGGTLTGGTVNLFIEYFLSD